MLFFFNILFFIYYVPLSVFYFLFSFFLSFLHRSSSIRHVFLSFISPFPYLGLHPLFFLHSSFDFPPFFILHPPSFVFHISSFLLHLPSSILHPASSNLNPPRHVSYSGRGVFIIGGDPMNDHCEFPPPVT